MVTVHDVTGPPRADEAAIREAAMERLRARHDFWMHLFTYTLVNGILVVMWFALGAAGLFWPVFPLAGWGIGLLLHGVEVFRPPLTEERIRREMDRLQQPER